MTSGDMVGTLGVTLLLLAYALNAKGFLSAQNYTYLGLNCIGSFLSGVASALIGFIPFVVLETVWCLVSLFALYRVYRGNTQEITN